MIFLSEPYLLALNPATEMDIVWIQTENKKGIVEFGLSESLGNVIETDCYEIKGLHGPHPDGTFANTPEECPEISVYQHIAKIENLKPCETIYYR